MSTPASEPQKRKYLSLFTDAKPTRPQAQDFLANSDLMRSLLDAAGKHGLTRVDRTAFEALLAPEPKSIDWTQVMEYADKLRDWNHRFEFGLVGGQIEDLMADLPHHAGPHLPTSIELLLGMGLQHDWEVVMQVLNYELGKLGVPFTEHFDASRLSYFPGSEPFKTRKPMLGVAQLDIGTFWDPQNGVTPGEVRTQRSYWPGLELAWLFAFNPQVYLAMDGETVPYMWAPGLVVDSGNLPCFSRDSDDGPFVDGDWDDYRWNSHSVVAFMQC